MGLFRKKNKLPEGDFRSDIHKRPLELGKKSNRITSSIFGFFGKILSPLKSAPNPFTHYNTLKTKRRIAGTNALLLKAYELNGKFVKEHASQIEKIRPTLTAPQITPFGADNILRAMGGIEARLERVRKNKDGEIRAMDKEDAFKHLGITSRLTVQELEILKKLEANRQYLLAESDSMLRQVALAALSPKEKREAILKDVNNRRPQLIQNTQLVKQNLLANRTLYIQLEQEYNAMYQRQIGKAGKEEFAGPGKTAKL